MLGVALLNEVMSSSSFEAPGMILNRLRDKVKETLAQEGRPHEQRDGMDMALAVIDNDKQLLHYAGAYNPLYLIRNKKQLNEGELNAYYALNNAEHQLCELKGDRQPISIYTIETDFESKSVRLKEGDSFYLFSDGFVDQKGGPKTKKFLSKNFKKLLLDIQSLSMDGQKAHLEETLASWTKNTEQMDDILVMGIRV